MARLNAPDELERLRQELSSRQDSGRPRVALCAGIGCAACGAHEVFAGFEREIEKQGLRDKVELRSTGCHGFCEKGPLVVIWPEGICYTGVQARDVGEIVSRTLVEKKVVERLVYVDPATGEKAVHEAEIPFYAKQARQLLSANARLDPRSIDDYVAAGGYGALGKVLGTMSPEQVIAEAKESGLRGRSGGGFPAGRKWEACRKAEADEKYVICNCHEGDPGAFVDRLMMEANPHAVLEGMVIGAYAMGAHEGYVFVGNELPQAVANVTLAIEQAEERGLLGKNILGSGFDFSVRVNIDGGGYVCGESTALMASMEGRVGEPIRKYDHATERGLWRKPTVLNNMQTWANVPLLIGQGAGRYGSLGTAGSKGTRVFSLVGQIRNCGLVEVPMGISLREVVFGIGGGIREGRKFKALQVGGPLGGFIPESMLDLQVDFDELTKAGVSMGPSLVAIDETACIVDMVKYFLTFVGDESCGKCTPCREGLGQMLKILTKISEGRGREGDVQLLEELSELQQDAALCALGQSASSPIRSALRHFRGEFEAHIAQQRCPAGFCKAAPGGAAR
jgi:NADH:ubiquinone oxidoreductase subunit F (NADH-binding)/(2Fe-2S) ferredoxin